MTRKDYILIAEVLRVEYHNANLPHVDETNIQQYHASGVRDGILGVATELCESLAHDNPRFNAEHFLAVVRGEKELNSRP